MSAKGSLLFFRSEAVVGMALSVERTYFGGQLACGDGVTEDYRSGQMILLPRTIATYIWRKNYRWWRLV